MSWYYEIVIYGIPVASFIALLGISSTLREIRDQLQEMKDAKEREREENDEEPFSYYDAFDDENTDEEHSPKKPQSKTEKLESELKDLNQWLELGLVPKKDLKRHDQEIDKLKKEIRKYKKVKKRSDFVSLRNSSQTSAELQVHSLDVCTYEQEKLLEQVVVWNEKEKRKYNDVEAAFTYLFFRIGGGSIFDPEGWGGSIKLTHQQLLNLKDNIELFVYQAKEIGFELEVNEALQKLKDKISSNAPPSAQRKMRWKGYFRLLGICSVILLPSLVFFSWNTSTSIACVGTVLFLSAEAFVKHLLEVIEKKHISRHSELLRKLNSNEISAQIEWAEKHLNKIGWLEKRKPLTKKQREAFKAGRSDLDKSLKKFKKVKV